jgi:hypothetical protein
MDAKLKAKIRAELFRCDGYPTRTPSLRRDARPSATRDGSKKLAQGSRVSIEWSAFRVDAGLDRFA